MVAAEVTVGKLRRFKAEITFFKVLTLVGLSDEKKKMTRRRFCAHVRESPSSVTVLYGLSCRYMKCFLVECVVDVCASVFLTY